MEIANFFKLLGKHKNILIIVPLVTVIVSFFLVKNLSDSYISRGQIATGISDDSRSLMNNDIVSTLQEVQVYREFSNLIATMKMKKLVDQVSYALIMHDLSNPTPFRKLSKEITSLHPEERDKALETFKTKFTRMESLSLYDKYENSLNEMLISMKYDERSLRKELIIFRDENSDFITVTYESENPLLSAFTVNTLCQRFISYYTQNERQKESSATTYLSNLLEEKRNALSEKTAELQKYKIRNGIIDLEEQSKAIFTQILTYNDKKLEADKDVASNEGALASLNKKFDPKDRKYIEASIDKYNQVITQSQEQMHQLTNLYVRSGFNPKYKASLDSLQNLLNGQINQSSDKYLTSPLLAKDDLIHQRLQLEVARDLAKYSVRSIGNELASLNAKFNRLVPFDATVKTYNFDIDIAGKEYMDALNKYNASNLKSTFSGKLSQVEIAIPDVAQPSKKMLLIILSAIISLFFCLLVLFVLFYLDDSIKEPTDLVNKTNLPLLGYLNRISGESLDLRKLWDVEHRDKMKQFKELLRSIRFEIDQELKGTKVLAITSLDDTRGKTILAISLAYSYSMINKKVLLIDGNFNNPTISKTAQPQIYLEDYFKNSPNNEVNLTASAATVFGNRGGDVTLLEISNEAFIQSRLDELKTKYDIILIDTPSLTSLNKAKEWLLFANKVIAVFEANKDLPNSQKPDVEYLRSLDTKFAGWVLNKTSFSTKK